MRNMLLAATAVVALAVGACSAPAPIGATSASPPPTRAATYAPPASAPLDTSIDGQGGGGDTPVDYSSSAQTLFSVSYTHLDVYKRQGIVNPRTRDSIDVNGC